MSRTTSPSTQKLYSLVRVCRVWRLAALHPVLAASAPEAPAGEAARTGRALCRS